MGGRELDVDALAIAAGLPLARVIRFVADCTRRGWLTSDGDVVAFRHDLLVEAVVANLPLDERDRLHLALGRAFARIGHAPGRAAFHLDAAGYLLHLTDVPTVRDVLAVLGSADPVALTLAERARDLDPNDVDVLCALLRCLAVRHRHSDATEHARRWCATAGDDPSLGQVRLLSANSMVATVGVDAALVALDELIAGDRLDAERTVEALNLITRLHWHRRDAAPAKSAASQALAASRAARSTQGELLALCSRSEAASLLGNIDDALADAHAARSLAAAESLATAAPALALGTALSVAGHMREGLPILMQSLREAERSGDPHAMVLAQVTMQATRFHIGEWDAFVADAEAMTDIARDTNLRAGVVLPLGFATAVEVRRGNFAGVAALAARARAEYTLGDGHPGALIGIGFVELAELESAGRFADACRYAADFARLLAPAGVSAQNLVVVDAARLAWQAADDATFGPRATWPPLRPLCHAPGLAAPYMTSWLR